jgi:hypothetical protein
LQEWYDDGMKLVELLQKGALPDPFWDGAEDAA